jgi:hypothetical protein
MNIDDLLCNKSVIRLAHIWIRNLEKQSLYPLVKNLPEALNDLKLNQHRVLLLWENKYDSYGIHHSIQSFKSDWSTQVQVQIRALHESTGQMLGILLCQVDNLIDRERLSALCLYDPCYPKAAPRLLDDDDNFRFGDYVILCAYSGQLAGVWNHAQWAGSLYQQEQFASASIDTQIQLSFLNHIIRSYSSLDRSEVNILKAKRKKLSRQLTHAMYESCHFYNSIGEHQTLSQLWSKAPMGTGDCCAPKLLVMASRFSLKVIGLAEFWWHPQKKHHKSYKYAELVAPCRERCVPLLPFLLKSKDQPFKTD